MMGELGWTEGRNIQIDTWRSRSAASSKAPLMYVSRTEISCTSPQAQALSFARGLDRAGHSIGLAAPGSSGSRQRSSSSFRSARLLLINAHGSMYNLASLLG
jgi:hypothetical protein